MSTTFSKILILSYSAVFIKKINLLRLRHWCFPRKFGNFFRSSHQSCFMKKAVLKNFAIFTRKLQTCIFVKKRLQNRCFPLNNAKFFKKPILKIICYPLLLIFYNSYRRPVSSCFSIVCFLRSDNLLTGYEQLNY